MNSSVLKGAMLFTIALSQVDTVNAVRLEQQGIFDKMIAQEQSKADAEKEIQDARDRKKQQMVEAEKEHEQLVEEEERDQAKEDEKKQEEYEERLAEKKRQDQIDHHNQLLQEVMNAQNVQLVQLTDIEMNSAADIIGSGPDSNQELLQMYMRQDGPINLEQSEIDHNSAADMIGSGPAYIGYTLVGDDVDGSKKITEQDKAKMYAVAAATNQKLPSLAKTTITTAQSNKPIQKVQVQSTQQAESKLETKAASEKRILKEDTQAIGQTKEELKAVAARLQVYLTPSMLVSGDDNEVAAKVVEKAMAQGHTRTDVEDAMHQWNVGALAFSLVQKK